MEVPAGAALPDSEILVLIRAAGKGKIVGEGDLTPDTLGCGLSTLSHVCGQRVCSASFRECENMKRMAGLT